MRVKRGKNYIGLKLSGPQSTNVINEAEDTAERLAARNEWAFQMGQFFPDLPAILQVERCTQFPLLRFKRELVLTLDEKDGWWEVDARTRIKKSNDGDDGASPPPSGGPPDEGGGAGVSGKPQIQPSGGAAQTPPAPKHEADEYRPISAMSRRVQRRRPTQSWLAFAARGEWQRLRQTSLFGHIAFAFGGKMPLIAAAARRFLVQVQNALVLSHERYVDLYASFSGAEQLVQDRWAGAVLEPKTFDYAGLRLTLLTFSAYARPNWESWLFGRLPEDEQELYEVGQGT